MRKSLGNSKQPKKERKKDKEGTTKRGRTSTGTEIQRGFSMKVRKTLSGTEDICSSTGKVSNTISLFEMFTISICLILLHL